MSFLSYVDLRVALIFSFPLLICLLCTILPLTLPAGSLCMYVITDARFHYIRGSLQHTSLTLVRAPSFFCELVGLSIYCLFMGSCRFLSLCLWLRVCLMFHTGIYL